VADKAIDKLKDRVRELTRRTRGNRIEVIAAELRESLLGWKAYFGISRSAEPSARHRQVDTTQVTLLSLETMGAGGLSGTAQARGIGARSVEHQQVRPWAVAFVEDPRPGFGAYPCATSRTWEYRALPHGKNSIHRTAGYVTRSSGGVGGRGREASSYPDSRTGTHAAVRWPGSYVDGQYRRVRNQSARWGDAAIHVDRTVLTGCVRRGGRALSPHREHPRGRWFNDRCLSRAVAQGGSPWASDRPKGTRGVKPHSHPSSH
jgi:hypothetical protein